MSFPKFSRIVSSQPSKAHPYSMRMDLICERFLKQRACNVIFIVNLRIGQAINRLEIKALRGLGHF
jgi:hypothetical protein